MMNNLVYHRFKDMTNVTPWSELKDLDVVWTKGGTAISEEQAKATGTGDLVLRQHDLRQK